MQSIDGSVPCACDVGEWACLGGGGRLQASKACVFLTGQHALLRPAGGVLVQKVRAPKLEPWVLIVDDIHAGASAPPPCSPRKRLNSGWTGGRHSRCIPLSCSAVGGF